MVTTGPRAPRHAQPCADPRLGAEVIGQTRQRHLWDSSPRRETPSAKQTDALATRPKCLEKSTDVHNKVWRKLTCLLVHSCSLFGFGVGAPSLIEPLLLCPLAPSGAVGFVRRVIWRVFTRVRVDFSVLLLLSRAWVGGCVGGCARACLCVCVCKHACVYLASFVCASACSSVFSFVCLSVWPRRMPVAAAASATASQYRARALVPTHTHAK